MTEGEPTDRLSEKRQFVLVLRLTVEAGGNVRGELVDPLSHQRQRLIGLERLADALRVWVDDALSRTVRESGSQPNRDHTDT
jgi:hypothetical protein